MPEEIGVILENLQSINSEKFGDLELFSGTYKIEDYGDMKIDVPIAF